MYQVTLPQFLVWIRNEAEDIIMIVTLFTQQGDFAAAKVAGLELKGSIAYFNAAANENQELRLPMIALVDYFGFRLIAISLLPIGEGTLVYGTGDAGKTIYASDEKFNAIMERTAARLNLSSHYCGSGMRNEPVCCWSQC